MLVDQYMGNGVEVTFFGRKTKANPTLARLLRQVECPVHGVRIIRLPNHRFRAELSEEVTPARDAAGQIDIQGTMQAVTACDRRLGAGISGPVAVAAPEVAIAPLRASLDGLPYPPNSKPRLHAFIVTADPRMKTICSSVRVEKNARMLVM